MDALSRLISFVLSKREAALRDRNYPEWHFWTSMKKQIGKDGRTYRVTEASDPALRAKVVISIYQYVEIYLEDVEAGKKISPFPLVQRRREARGKLMAEMLPYLRPTVRQHAARRLEALSKLTAEERKLLNLA